MEDITFLFAESLLWSGAMLYILAPFSESNLECPLIS